MWKGAPSLMSSEHRVNLNNPYREGTKLHHIFAFMQDGCWHYLRDITNNAWSPSDVNSSMGVPGGNVYNRSRVASALRTIRSHSALFVDYDGERYCMGLQPQVRTRSLAPIMRGMNGD